MKTVIRKTVDADGVLIPRPILVQSGMDGGEVELIVEDESIVLRKPQQTVRAGWAQASQALAQTGEDQLVWPEFANEADKEIEW
ncbi:AbrB/MazE/SpoVT family DNA-binding domain-containing protein [Pseudoduganella violacea]|uniref:Antitoxin MazE n=1 Tax=Pseudoduganella violacea TaxID=1715466 RepID=A0A7W5BC89_9BURK|nr:AbrB/MazE/SpoVT family DNA-binding domain-containing protein [Pseudoduganella violacea]MBB3120459.1 antitoxin MazE [Pseudoduganella violacea]